MVELVRGGIYRFKGAKELLIYVGKVGSWHQFEVTGDPGVIWCELLDTDLHLIEKVAVSVKDEDTADYPVLLVCRRLADADRILRKQVPTTSTRFVAKTYGMPFRGEKYSALLVLDGAHPLNERDEEWLDHVRRRVYV